MENFYNIRRFALILALQAEIEGMKAMNAEKESNGEAMAYGENAFYDKAEELRALTSYKSDELFKGGGMSWKKDYWIESISDSLESAGIKATKEQIEAIAADTEISADQLSMAGGSDYIKGESSAEKELKELRKEKEERETFARTSKRCEFCKGHGYISDGYGREQGCDMCGGTGRTM